MNQILDKIKLQHSINIDTAIIARPDQRLGNTVSLVAAMALPQYLIDQFNDTVLPFERIRNTHLIDVIPRTALGKLRRSELLKNNNF